MSRGKEEEEEEELMHNFIQGSTLGWHHTSVFGVNTP
jgi:hypothetical protein